MGRSFASVRQGVKGPLDRWARTVRELREEDQPFGESVVALARLHSSEAFYGCDEPLEAAVFSGLMAILIQQEEGKELETEQKIPVGPDDRKGNRREARDVDP